MTAEYPPPAIVPDTPSAQPRPTSRTVPDYACVLETGNDVSESLALCDRYGICPSAVRWFCLSEDAFVLAQSHRLGPVDVTDVLNLDTIKLDGYTTAERFVVALTNAACSTDRAYWLASTLALRSFLSKVLVSHGVATSLTTYAGQVTWLLLDASPTVGTLRFGDQTGPDGVFRSVLRAVVRSSGYRFVGRRDWARHFARLALVAWQQLKNARGDLLPKSRLSALLGVPGGDRQDRPAPTDLVLDDSANDLNRCFAADDLAADLAAHGVRAVSYPKGEPQPCSNVAEYLQVSLATVPRCWRSLRRLWRKVGPVELSTELDPIFYQVLHLCFRNALGGRARCLSLLRGHSPVTLAASDLDSPEQRMVLLTARACGVRTVSFPHSGGYVYAAPSDTYLADRVLVNGLRVREYAVESGVPTDCVLVSGSPAVRRLLGLDSARAVAPRPRVLVVLRGVTSWADLYSVRQFRDTLSGVLEHLARRPDWDVTVKAHPITFCKSYLDHELSSFGVAGGKGSWSAERWGWERFRDWDVAIIASGLTTVTLLLAALGVPQVFITSAVSECEWKVYRPDVHGCGFAVDTPAEAVAATDRILTADDFRHQVLVAGRAYVERFAAPVAGTAVLAALVRREMDKKNAGHDHHRSSTP